MHVAFLGVGHIAEAMIKGIMASAPAGISLSVSSRGRGLEVAQQYALGAFADNCDLVRVADLVILATRPQHAIAAITGLPWEERHTLLSACAGIEIEALTAVANPARIGRIMPLTAASVGSSPTAVFPLLPDAQALLEAIGTVIPLETEDQFRTATVSAAVYGWVQNLIEISAAWSERQGLPPETARLLTASTFSAAGRVVALSHEPIAQLLHNLATPGGITERGLETLSKADVPGAWRAACDAVHEKLTQSVTQ